MPTDACAASALVSARRGQILGFEARVGWAGWEALRALIPEAEIGDLIVGFVLGDLGRRRVRDQVRPFG